MRTVAFLDILLKLVGMILMLLGLCFWAGVGYGLLPVHMALGLVFVLTLVSLSMLAFRGRVRGGLPPFVAAWALVVLALGVTQRYILPGDLHWLIRALHLLVGGLGVFFGVQLVRRMQGPARNA